VRIAHSFVYVLWLMLCHICIQDKGCDEVVFKAMGRAINKTVMIAELIKVPLTVAVHVNHAFDFILNNLFIALLLHRGELWVSIKTLPLNPLILLTHGSHWRKACFRKNRL
jgi:hypothetical protein